LTVSLKIVIPANRVFRVHVIARKRMDSHFHGNDGKCLSPDFLRRFQFWNFLKTVFNVLQDEFLENYIQILFFAINTVQMTVAHKFHISASAETEGQITA
jgi:hypothetical protein